jgi:TolA-binding protein
MIRDDESSAVSAPSIATLAGLARGRLGEISDLQNARGLHAVVAKLGQARANATRVRARRFWLASAGAVTALGLAAVVFGPRLAGGRPLTYAMSQGEIQTGGYFQSETQAQPTIRFSDGTKVDLMAGARGRIASVDAHGARVLLDEGEAHVEVVPRPGAYWQFDAGPFVVHVHGTGFVLAWNGDEGRLDLRLNKGAVSVTGPLSDQGIALRPGQWLTVRLAAREVFVREFDRAAPPPLSGEVTSAPTPVASVPPLATPEPEPEPELTPAPAPTSRQARPRRQPHAAAVQLASPEISWAPARATGDWNRIFDLATQRGLERTLSERRSEDLALLADAAHYLRKDDIAEQALLAQRRRYPGSTRAKDAAFLLGRIVEAKSGGASEALGWYERHLEEAPHGTYASEALGRKMTVLARLHGDAAARPVAEEYLQRYPGGTYARAARAYARKP